MKIGLIFITILFIRVASSDAQDTCAQLATWSAIKPTTEEQAQQQYDTLRLYIEKCGNSDTNSWEVFINLNGADQFRSADTNRFAQYRAWLISVLFLNKIQPEYFCACMGSIQSTFQIGKFKDIGGLAVENYMRTHHPECLGSNENKQYTKDSQYVYNEGLDPTRLPSLDSLGLDFLLKSTVPTTTSFSSQYFASFTSISNPFIKETTLEFTLNRMSYVTLAVYDELGRLVWGDGKGSSLEAGTHAIHLNGNALPSGTLYARIATGFGEVKTVKLVHEK